ncbi:hypothetical protein AgCh_018995 [Apium graveolens]
MMRSPSNESLPALQRPQYETRSRFGKIAGNGLGPSFYDHKITSCPQEVNVEEIHSHSVKTKDLGSCLAPNSTNMPGVQNSDNLQNTQKSASFMHKDIDFNLQNLRKSPRLSVQNREDKYVFESNEEGVKCRSNSQLEGLDKKEVTLAKSPRIDYQNISVEQEQETNLRNVRKSSRFSEEARERDMQLLFRSPEKITNCKKKSRIKDVDQEKFMSPAEVNLVNMAKVHEESSNDEGKRGMGLQSFVNSSSKGICTRESHINSTFKSNLSLKTKAVPASMPHFSNTDVSYGRIMNSQSIRKSVRFSGKNGEMDLQKKNVPSEFSFDTDVELTTVLQVQNKSSDCDKGTDLKTMQKSLQLSCRSRETNLDRNIECSEEGRTMPQENSSHLSTSSVVKVFNKPQIQNVSANSNGHMESIDRQNLTHLSGTKRQRDLQKCSRKEVRLGAESRKRGRPRKYLSLTSEVGLKNAPSAQNQTVKSNKDGINLGVETQKKGFDGGTMSLPIEVELTSELGAESRKRGRPRKKLSLTSEVDLTKALAAQNQTVKSNKDEINLGVKPQKKGFDGSPMSLPTEVELTSEPGAESRKRGRPRKNLSLTSEVDLTKAPSAQNQTAKSNEDEINLGVEPQKKGFDGGTMSLPIEVELTSEPGAESRKRGRPRKNLSLTSEVDLTKAPSAQNQTVKSNEDEINLGVKPQKKGFDGGTMSLPIEVELTSEPSLHSEFVQADGCLLNKAIGSPLNSSKSLPSFQYYVSSGKGINLVVDLNSSPSDWTKKIFSSSSQTLQNNKFECFRHEIESLRSKKMISSLVSTSNPFNPGHLQNNAGSQLVSGETCPLRSYIPERDNGSSDVTQTNSCIDVRTRDGHIENSSDVNTQTSGDNISSHQEYLVLNL